MGSCSLLPHPRKEGPESTCCRGQQREKEDPVSWPKCNSPPRGSAVRVHLVLGPLCAGLTPSWAESFCSAHPSGAESSLGVSKLPAL